LIKGKKMADEEEVVEESSGGGKSKLIIIIVGVVVLIGATIGITLFSTGFFNEESSETIENTKDEKKVIEKDDPSYVVIHGVKPIIKVTLPSGGSARFLLLEVTVLTHYDDVYDVVRKHMPRIRNSLVLMLSDINGKAVKTVNGRKKLRKEVLAVIQADVKKYMDDDINIDNVFFTKFVMQ
jgi:flagellar FliL protein